MTKATMTTLFIVTSALIAQLCSCGTIIETPDRNEASLIEATVNILEWCYMDREMSTVGVTGVSATSISKMLSFGKPVVPIILIDEISSEMDKGLVSPESQHKLQVFVVTVTDSRSLVKTLLQMKQSRWWNHMAGFLLLDWATSKNGCSKAYEMLWESWKMDLLNAKFICFDKIRGQLIYTFNPYTSKAPMPWQLENTYKGIKDHIWSLFVRVYRGDEKICEELDFDKTTDLGGYEIRASVMGMENWWHADPTKKPRILSRAHNISAQILMDSLNATWKFRKYSHNNSSAESHDNSEADIINNISDMGLNIHSQFYTINYKTTYPHMVTGLAVVTQFRGHKSQLEKIASVLDRSCHIGLFLVCLTTFIFLKFFHRNSSMQAILNLVRLISNGALLTISTKLSPRLYLGCLFVFIVTIQGIYQGQLASLLTKEVPLPNVNSVQDLAKFGYTVYGNKVYFASFDESVFKGRYIRLNTFNCTGYVLRDTKAACMFEKYESITNAVEFGLHLSREMVIPMYGVQIIRSDWPLENRVNKVYQKTFESDLIEHTVLREGSDTLQALESYENRYENQPFKAITLGELSFAFVILGIGLGCSIISFIIEIAFEKTRM